jgi:hypothetical protein
MKRQLQIVRTVTVCGVVLLCLVAPAVVRAQNAEGTILGHVTDPSGATVPGAKVTIRNLQTNVTNTFTTTSSGDYVVPDLIPGNYQVTVHTSRRPGLFARFRLDGRSTHSCGGIR